MTKRSLKLSMLAAITGSILFAGCASQVQMEPPRKQDFSTETGAEHHITSTPMETRVGETRDIQTVAEDFPEVAEERAVFFTLGSASLAFREKQKLESISEQLVADRHLHVSLLGYANDNGSRSFNLAVSDRRVIAVAAFLRQRGVQAGQIRTQALGSEKLASDCRSPRCRQQFRRVDLVVGKGR